MDAKRGKEDVMKLQAQAKAERFHGHLDTELCSRRRQFVETKETKHLIIQEREVSYRFFLHQHPFVQPLMQRLLRRTTSGLQAADTEYAPNAASLPGSIGISLGSNTNLT